MKTFICMIFIVAFIVIFQQNPIAGMIIIAIVGGGYIFLKSRKNSGRGLFRSGAISIAQDETQKLITYMLLRQLSSNHSSNHPLKKDETLDTSDLNEHDKARQELLKILE